MPMPWAGFWNRWKNWLVKCLKLETLFQRALDTHQTMFAMGEAIAHLNHLQQAGRLSCSSDADGVIRFLRLQN